MTWEGPARVGEEARYIRSQFLYQYIARYLFIRAHPDKNTRLHHFFDNAATLYPPQGDRLRQPPPLPISDESSDDEGSQE